MRVLAPYFAYSAISMKHQFAYRVANWAGLFTNTFFLIFRSEVFGAAYAGRGEVAGFTGPEAMCYAAVTQSLLMVIPQWGLIGIGDAIKSGEIASDLYRPVNYPALHLAKRLGISGHYMIMRMVPILTIAALFGYMIAPPSLFYILPFALSVLMGAVIGNSMLFLVSCSAFWMESERGAYRVHVGVGALLSGLILPVSFFPDWAQAICNFMPFQYTLYLPARVYLGHYQGSELYEMLAYQGIWMLLMLAFCEIAFRLGTRKLVIHGG